MGIIKVTRLDSDGGSVNLSGLDMTVDFMVECDIAYNGFFDMLLDFWQHPDGVAIGNIYYGTRAFDFKPKRLASYNYRDIWQVSVNWKTLTKEEQDKQDNPPLDRASVHSWKSQPKSKILEKWPDGTAVRNAADDAFSPAFEFEDGDGVKHITKNFDIGAFDPTNYLYKVNSGPLFGYPARTLLCTVCNVQETAESYNDGSKYWFWATEWEFKYDADEHQAKILEQGFNIWVEDPEDSSQEIKVIAKDEFNQNVADPVLLDEEGHKLPKDAAPVFLERDYRSTADFSGLGL